MSASLAGGAEAIWQAVVPDLPGFTVEVLEEIDSTNTELMRRARTAPLDPVLLVAERQTAGRGRLGRGWHSRPGQSLTFSLGLSLAPRSWSGLSLAVGLVLAEQLHPDVRIKWPNDLWLMGRKLGGILVETAGQADDREGPRSVVIGAGINVARPAESALAGAPASPMGGVPPAGLAEVEVGVTPAELLPRLVPPLVREVLRFASEGFAPFAARYAARDALKDRELRLSDGSTGSACGVAEDGALLVRVNGQLRRVDSAEVSVRPC
ncbi:MAG: biotin--[acetyl-CoA-carboxylase] ligase [Comamonadaceae bacterium]|jgi:BirA family biotin operon repressor/biotin-[acetyl-CoA-carboxylase] ligase|uniref:biotin--[biotin carboxyl-carrier protein] ligase n=1 Tax=Hydrogenophaga borbori TaxID=2294117 RepID=A0A372EH15_9BURK|nr:MULTISPECIES: biotin--[acetyl-CoA-carboxylase] ligase [Hydrogenophaga]NCT99050.1 biotin--[acetyl-CoA-carboxylase] ligase [Comamonadaceae bacterium]RFP77719.1 biotin--[acetyl-CoA-carboxylase] ligase [Hydrogenophaga borbori]WQB83684.1 biotin--[acetyl-CoA-carboxylase] ligase [Hydrogenophaga sp. SNF1]